MSTQAIDWVTPALTAALVIITIYYAWQTQRMVREIRRARELSVAPKLAVSFRVLFPRFGVVTVQNVGLGPATTVDMYVTFEPAKSSVQPMEKRRFRTNVMMPGEEHRFYPPPNEHGSIMDAGEVAQHFSRFILNATFRDPLGNRHVVHESMEDYPEFWEMARASGHALQTIPEEVAA